MSEDQKKVKYSRRRFLAAGVAGAAGLAAAPAWARDTEEWMENRFSWTRPKLVVERDIAFTHRHTGETLRTVYYANGRYIPSALDEVNWLLRDFRINEVKEIDPQLLDLLYAVRQRLESNEAFEVYSGYRSPETNARLRMEGWGVARNSLHMQGKAIDVRIPGIPLSDLRDAAKSLNGGGVGFYPRDRFVHVDTGKVRYW